MRLKRIAPANIIYIRDNILKYIMYNNSLHVFQKHNRHKGCVAFFLLRIQREIAGIYKEGKFLYYCIKTIQ
jgi:hypothetical protein